MVLPLAAPGAAPAERTNAPAIAAAVRAALAMAGTRILAFIVFSLAGQGEHPVPGGRGRGVPVGRIRGLSAGADVGAGAAGDRDDEALLLLRSDALRLDVAAGKGKVG